MKRADPGTPSQNELTFCIKSFAKPRVNHNQMKSFIIGLFIFTSLIFILSCKDIKQSDVSYSNQDSIIASKTLVKNNGEKV